MGNCTSGEISTNKSIARGEPSVDLTSVDMTSLPKRNILHGRHQARVKRVYDGDTMTLAVVLDGVAQELNIRLYGCNCPEIKGPSRSEGLLARKKTLKFIDAERENFEKPVMIMVEFVPKPEKYGRYLAKVSMDGKSLSDHLIKTGYAVEFMTDA